MQRKELVDLIISELSRNQCPPYVKLRQRTKLRADEIDIEQGYGQPSEPHDNSPLIDTFPSEVKWGYY